MKVVLIAALTADGFIARSSNELSTDWTSTEDRHFFRDKTRELGVIIMGANTFRAIGRALPKRRNIVYSTKPIDVPDIEVTQEPPADLLARLAADGHGAVAICGGSTVYRMFLEAGLVDELFLSIEPHLFGQGIRLSDAAHESRLRLLDCLKLNDDVVLLHYKVVKE